MNAREIQHSLFGRRGGYGARLVVGHLTGVSLALLTLAGAVAAAQEPAIVLPERKSSAVERPAIPPLPPLADAVKPATLVLVRRAEEGGGRQTVTRTAHRVHIARDAGNEWLFQRNPVDPRRVSGYHVVHDARTIVVFSDSDLLSHLSLRGWADVLRLDGGLPDNTDGRSGFVLDRAMPGVNAAVLELPMTRFADYAVVDWADWLETD